MEMSYKKDIHNIIEEHRSSYIEISDAIWEFAESSHRLLTKEC